MNEKLNNAIKLRNKKKYIESEKIFLELLKNDSSNPLFNYHYAWLLDNIGNEEKAFSLYEKALKNNLTKELRADCYLGLGSTYRMIGNIKKSKEIFKKAILEFPNSYELHLFNSLTFFENGEKDIAYFKLLETLLEVNNNKEIKNLSKAILSFIETNKNE